MNDNQDNGKIRNPDNGTVIHTRHCYDNKTTGILEYDYMVFVSYFFPRCPNSYNPLFNLSHNIYKFTKYLCFEIYDSYNWDKFDDVEYNRRRPWPANYDIGKFVNLPYSIKTIYTRKPILLRQASKIPYGVKYNTEQLTITQATCVTNVSIHIKSELDNHRKEYYLTNKPIPHNYVHAKYIEAWWVPRFDLFMVQNGIN